MKILVISQHYYPENFRITDICETLVQLGNEVTVITGLPNYPEGVVLKEYRNKKNRFQIMNGVKIIRCFEIGRGKNKIKLFLNYYSICLSMRKKAKHLKEDFDVVLINQLSPVMVAWAGLKYAKKHKVSTYLYCYDLWPDSLAAGGIKKDSLIYKYYYRISNKIYKKADSIMVTSKLFINYFQNIHHIERKKLFYLPQYCEDLFDKIQSKEKIENKYEFVFAGNIGKMQSVETIIEAANLIKNDLSIHIHIVGNGSNLEQCKNLVKNYNLENIIFHGRQPIEKMKYFYELADAMIVTLKNNEVISNTLPGKVQSYMSAGKPIIASINGETQLILKEAKCGLICNAEDYHELANLFLQFKTENAKILGKNAKEYYLNNFSKDLFFKSLIEKLEGEKQ